MSDIVKHYDKLILDKLNNKLYAAFLLCFLGLFVYSNTFLNSFHFDDQYSIVENPAIRDIGILTNIWHFWPTRFITYLSIAFSYHTGRLSVFDYHVFNFLTHLGSAFLVWWLAILTFNTPVLKKESISACARPAAFFCAAIFLLHPIQTQPVNYIIQRATLLAGFFYLASLCLYARARLELEDKDGPGIQKAFYGGSILCALMSMFCKENSVSLPLAVCFYEACFFGNKKSLFRRYVLMFLPLIFIIPLTMLITRSVDFQGMRRVAEIGPGISSKHYFLTQFRVMVTYLRLLFIPVNQNVDYYYPVSRSFFESQTVISFLLLASVVLTGIKCFYRYRLFSFCIFWFFITLLPESSLIPIRDVIFEHRLYLSCAGFALFLASAPFYLLRGNKGRLVLIMLSLLLVCYSVMAYQRNMIWKDEFTLWNDAVRKSPLKARPYYTRGLAYQNNGDLKPAIADYNRAIELDPDLAEAYNNRGVLYAIMGGPGQLDQALSDFTRVIEINPEYAEAYNNRAMAYFKKGLYDKSWGDVHKAQILRFQVKPEFLDGLRKTSGREN